MLLRVRGEELGLCPELATWQRGGGCGARAGWRGEGREAPARGGVGPGVKGVTHGAVEQQEVASQPSLGGGGAALRRRQSKQRSREEEDTG